MSDNEKVLNSFFKDSKKETGTDEIICIVDRSGSMQLICEDAEGGLNSFIEDQKKVGEANLTIVEFDYEAIVVCDRININEAQEYKLKPRGATALLDAIGKVIGDVDKYTSKNGKTIVVVITDGAENASREWDRDAIFKLINERKEAGWEFMFLASGQDAIKVGSSYGFDANSTMSYAGTKQGVTTAHQGASLYTTALRTSSKLDALATKTEFVTSNAEVLSETGEVKDK